MYEMYVMSIYSNTSARCISSIAHVHIRTLHILYYFPGMWLVPATIGDKPPPCAFFSYTAVDSYRAVLFAGIQSGHTVNDAYILNHRIMVHSILISVCCFVTIMLIDNHTWNKYSNIIINHYKIDFRSSVCTYVIPCLYVHIYYSITFSITTLVHRSIYTFTVQVTLDHCSNGLCSRTLEMVPGPWQELDMQLAAWIVETRVPICW